MALVVQKYGGTSVGSIEKIKNVANKVAALKRAGNDVAVVLSAMSGETDRLLNLAHDITSDPDERELDSLVSTGEQITVTLLAMVLNSMGYRARSFLGFQIPIRTDDAFGKARILEINGSIIKKEWQRGAVVIVAGFQGVDFQNNITTLGRGGSDTSAVAVAAALNADVCEIYTDVDGVYTADPNICQDARRLDKISYDEMLELARAGAKVLQARSVEMAKKYDVPLLVKSTFTETGGTLVSKEDKDMEKEVVSGVTQDKDQAKLTIVSVPDRPGIAAEIFGPLAAENIVVDMIIQNASVNGNTDITFTISCKESKRAKKIVEDIAAAIGAKEVIINEKVAKVSIVGAGMVSHSGVAAKMFSTLFKENINIMMISTSEIKISCVIEAKYTELAVMALHDAFELGKRD